MDNASVDRFSISSFISFTLVGNQPLNSQLHQFQELLRKVHNNETILNIEIILTEEFKLTVFIDILPPSWESFINHLRIVQSSMSFYDILNSIRVEEKCQPKTNKLKTKDSRST